MRIREPIAAETVCKTRDGQEVPVAACCSAPFDEQGNPTGVMEVILDKSSNGTPFENRRAARLYHSPGRSVDHIGAHGGLHRGSAVGEAMPGVDKMAGVAQLSGGRLALALNVAEVVKGLQQPLPVQTAQSSSLARTLCTGPTGNLHTYGYWRASLR